jgi:sugar lactone lactonase YvrE
MDLLVTIKNGETVRIANFFAAAPDATANDLVFQNEDGALWQAQYDAQATNGFTLDDLSSIDQLIADAGVIDTATPVWALAGLGLLGAGGAVAGAGALGGGSGGGSSSQPGVPAIPSAPGDLVLSSDGLRLTGTGQAGNTITIGNSAGAVLGSAVVAADGTFEVTLDTPQTNGEVLTAIQTDAAGNASQPASLTAGDTTAPDAPGDLTVNADGSVLTGTGEVGARIEARAADGTLLGSATVASDGTFSLALSPAQTSGQALLVSATDAAGNASVTAQALAPVVATPGGDTTPPEAPTEVVISGSGTLISGRGEAGSTVTVIDTNGNSLGSATVGADGLFSVTISPSQNNGQTVQVFLSDASGNLSQNVVLQAPDITAPLQPTDLALSAEGLTLTGTAEPGARIVIRNADNEVIGITRAEPDGRFSASMSSAQRNGEFLELTVTDAAGNSSSPLVFNAPDTLPPEQPTDVVISADGVSLSGKGEAGSTVRILDASGNEIGTGTVAANGTFQITLSAAASENDVLSIVLSDAAGNTSTPLAVTVPDASGPVTPANLSMTSDGSQLSGTAGVGDTIEVRGPDGTLLGSALVQGDGIFTVALSPAQADGEVVDVVAVDSAGERSVTVPLTAPDITAPLAATDLAVSSDGLSLTGRGEAGATVTVLDAQGNVLGTAPVLSTASFSVPLTPPQINGQILQVVVTDASGNPSPAAQVAASDLDGPLQPSALQIDTTGTLLTGVAQSGSTITVTDINGVPLGSAPVRADDSFSVVLNSPQNNGQTLVVGAIDASGNASPQTSFVTPDTQAPAPLSNLQIDSAGLVLTGTGEADAQVTVRGPDGTVIGSTTVASDGTFVVSLSAQQIDAQTLSATQTDPAGNQSAPATVIAPDFTPPGAVTEVNISATGLLVTGQGEVGATVIVSDASGARLGSATVAGNGRFEVALSPAQINGQSLSVSQLDAAQNPSPPVAVEAPDIQAPDAPADLLMSPDGLTLQGSGETGATVFVRDPAGNLLGSGPVEAGRFVISFTSALTNGQQLQVSQTDPAGNPSPPATVAAGDTTAPLPLSNLAISANGVTVNGNGEAGARVEVRDGSNTVLGSTLVQANGQFSLTLATPQLNGQSLSVTQSDAAGNTSPPTALSAPDVTAPAAPTGLSLDASGTLLTGLAQPSSRIEIRGADGTLLGADDVDASGAFEIALAPAQLNGELLQVTATDAATNVSLPASVTAPDITPPVAVEDLAVSPDGTLVSGTAEPDSTVTVRDANGVELGSDTAGNDGVFVVTLNPPAPLGSTLVVVSQDAEGNASSPVTVAGPDGTQLVTPGNLLLADDGATLTGTATPGTTATAVGSDGAVLGTAPVTNAGSFTLLLSPPQLNGQTVYVSSSDGTSVSVPASLVAVDVTLPDPVTGVAINADGSAISGQGEAGATVTVSDAAGNALGSAIVGASGAFIVSLDPVQRNAQSLTVLQRDAAGNASQPSSLTAPDLQAPDAATALSLNEVGTVVSGAGEAGATVTVASADGVVLASAIVDQSGRFQVTLPFAQLTGEPLQITLTDAAGNVSPVASIDTPDRTPPGAVQNLVISADGSLVSGAGEIGATVTVADANGNPLGSAVVGSDGLFRVPLAPAPVNGELLDVSQTDPSGNASPSVILSAPDITAPAPLSQVVANADGVTLTGNGEPGATVSVFGADGAPLGSGLVGSNGSFSVTMTPPQLNAQLLTVTQEDPPGNVSTFVTVVAVDLTPPAIPGDLQLNDTGLQLTGTAEPSSQITVRDSLGTTLGSATTNANGTFLVTLETAQNDGQSLSVTATDAAGNLSQPASFTAADTTAPLTVTNLAVSADGLILAGNGEVGASVAVSDASGTVLGTGTVADDGRFSITLTPPATTGSTLSVVQADGAGNASPSASVVAPGPLAESAPTNLAIAADGLVVTGNATAGSTVSVVAPSGQVLGSATVDADGIFAVSLASPQLNGERLSAIATSSDGINSQPTALVAADSTPPAPLSDLVLAADGLSLSGRGEANATVTVLGTGGVILGTVQVGPNGTFALTLATAQIDGQALSLSQSDLAGNESVPVTLLAPDLVAPDAPTQLAVSGNGLLLSGLGEAGASVTVFDVTGTLLGSTVARLDGSFEVQLSPPQANGQLLSVRQADASGNVSTAASVTSADTTAPDALSQLAIGSDGATLTGRGEAGARVTVTDTGGTVLGTATVGDTGAFVLVLGTPLTNAELLTLVQTDAAGNVSPVATLTTLDLTPPDVLSEVRVTADGVSVTGRGEPGATVTVRDEAGNLLGSNVVQPDGSFGVVLDIPQLNDELLTVQQADPPGNISAPVQVNAPDLTPPATPANLQLNASGDIISGTGESGAQISVTLADGRVVGTGIVGDNGTFQFSLTEGQRNGEQLQVTLTDNAGNRSASGSLIVPDTTAPDPVTGLAIDTTGSVLSGAGEAGAEVRVTNAAGETLGTGIVQPDGSFSVQLDAPQLNGEQLFVVQRDGASNSATPVSLVAPDQTPPAPPVPLSLLDGVTLLGSGEAGATVYVTSAAGVELGSSQVLSDGSFSVTLNAAQLNGELLTLWQVDPALNASATELYTAPDVTDPDTVQDLSVSANGLTLSGAGEAGATVYVTNAAGTQLGEAEVQPDGRFTVSLSSAQLDGETLTVVQVDPAQNRSVAATATAPDITAPLSPLFNLGSDGSSVSGTAEPGSTVEVWSSQGTLLGTDTANTDGDYVVALNPPQTNGQALTITALDDAGNRSAPTPFTAPDSTPPAAVTALVINEQYNQLAGRGEPGARVVVRNAQGELGNGIVETDGTFTVELVASVGANDQLTVVQTDAAGNPSISTPFTVPLTPPPAAPANLALSSDGLLLIGTAVADSTITVYDENGIVIGTGTAAPDGVFSIVLDEAQTNGESLGVTASTPAGGESIPTQLLAGDTTPPAPLTELAINASGTQVTGRGEAGATVTVLSADGVTVLGTAIVGSAGLFSATLIPPQANGELLSARQSDTAGNVSAAQPLTAPDITAPLAPTDLALTANGVSLNGRGEAGAIVQVRSATGATLGTGTVAADGTFIVTLSAPQLNGEALSVTLRDAAGNLSSVSGFSAPDVTAPTAPGDLSLNPAGVQLSGTGEAGAVVTVYSAGNAVLGSATVAANGLFTVQLNSAQLNGQPLTVRQVDAAGNISPDGSLTAADVQAPGLPTGLTLATDGASLNGLGEPNATVNVYGPGNVLLGSTTVGSNGTFTVPLSTAQLDGQLLTVRLTDAAGNTSAPGSIVAPDVTPPGAPSNVAVNASGTVVTGTGIAGSTVTVRNVGGLVLGTATVGANGSFSVALSAAQINNEQLLVTQADAAGNVSTAAQVSAPDLIPPTAASALLVSGDGLLVTGTGEPGATVTIRSANGTTLGTAQVSNEGTFTVTLSPPQINGETLSVRLADARGNLSSPATVTAPDVDADAPVVANDNLATARVDLVPVSVTQNYSDSFTTLLSGFTKTYTFTVANGTTVDPTLTLTTSSLLSLLDGVVYTLQVQNASGTWVTLDVNGSGGLLDLIALAGQGVRVEIGDLLSGNYRLVVSSTGVGLVTTVNTQLELEINSLTQFNGVAGPAVTGNVITDTGPGGQPDLTGPDNGATLQILKSGSYVAAGAGTSVQGLYGTLVIDANGNYRYTPNGSASSVGKVDTFSYQLAHPNGLTDTANLYVRIDSPQATEIWDDSSLGSPAFVVNATDDVAQTNITLANREVTTTSALGSFTTVLGGGSGAYLTSVEAGTVSDLTVVLNASNLLSVASGLTVGLYKQNAAGQYVLVQSYGGGSLLNLGGGNYGVRFDDQTAGNYQVRVALSGVGVLTTVRSSLINVATYTNQYVVGSYTPVAGNLLTDTAGAGPDVLGSAFTVLSVLMAGNTYAVPGYNGTTLTGSYGSLLVQADGSYVYTLNPGLTNTAIGQADVFTYRLTHPNGTSDTATLTINLGQAGAGTSATMMSVESADDSAVFALASVTEEQVLQADDTGETLDGSQGGAIALLGGEGDDTLVVVDQQFAAIDGGAGTDTLLWAGGDATIDLSTLQDRIDNIDVLDLNDSSAVTLTLSLSDLIAITSEEKDTLTIKGNDNDSIHLTDRWSIDGRYEADGIVYTQYTPDEDSSHHLWVQNGIHVV